MTLTIPNELERRRSATDKRLRQTASALRANQLRDDRYPLVTVYATGSLGRGEVGDESDLDVFIIDAADAGRDEKGLANLDRYQLVADLIRAGASAGFPPFSRDGDFLHVHPLDSLITFLGKPDEDHLNVFTARILLLLESTCLVGSKAYDRCVESVIDRYWAEDTEKHDFRPTILINDIVRYWKTLCLSYEGWRQGLGRPLDPEERVDLLKLKFNRLWLCFVGLAHLITGDQEIRFTREHARRLVELTPLERVLQIDEQAFRTPADEGRRSAVENEERATELHHRLETVLDNYGWWLEKANLPKAETLDWISDDDAYHEASNRAREFGDEMWSLVNLLADRACLTRYLLV